MTKKYHNYLINSVNKNIILIQFNKKNVYLINKH